MGPSIAVVEVAANPTFTTTDGYMDRETVQVSVFAGNDPDTARTLGKRARTLLSPHRNYVLLSFADGTEAMRIRGMSRLVKDPDKGPGGVDVYHMMTEATFLVNRSLS